MDKVSHREPFQPRAADWNSFIDAAEDYKRRSGGRPSGIDTPLITPSNTLIYVRNDSGDDRDQYEILGIDEPVILPDDNLFAFQQGPCFKGLEPTTADHFSKFAVLQQALKQDEIGIALLYGMTPVLVDAGIDAEQYADVKNTDCTKLQGRPFGAARIVWKDSGNGDQWAWVHILPPTSPLVLGVTSGGITALSGSTPGTGTVTIWKKSGSSIVTTSRTQTAYSLAGYDIPTLTKVKMHADSAGNLWIVWNDC